jgi:para-aminobenzoate synthetase component 1
MAARRVQRHGPQVSPAQALQRLTGEPTLVMLHGGPVGWTYLAWGMPAQVLAIRNLPGPATPDQTRQSPRPMQAVDGRAWSGRFRGGWFIQLDYDYPQTPATCWPVDAYVAWSPEGLCTLHAQDEAGLALLSEGLSRPAQSCTHVRLASALQPDWSAADHRARVERIRAYIAAGDIYQANLTMSFRARMHPGPANDIAAFLALTQASPAPFSALLRSPGRSIISHSPECFLSVDGDLILSEPIKGTCRRVPGEDQAVRARLLASVKDRAELAMIVDLTRNDLGRIAAVGSVAVSTPARVIDLPHVHHLVARIEAHLRAGVVWDDVLAATFPAGSITGAPKLRAMSIISELEARRRGAYCGSFGWVGSDGACDLAVAIRTVVMTDSQVQFAAGGGIVSDSDAASEWDELHAKASAMASAIGVPP